MKCRDLIGSLLLELIDAIPPVRGRVGAPRRRPDRIVGDKACHSIFNVVSMHIRGITPLVRRRGTEEDRGLGLVRWVIERTLAWLHQFRRLRVRSEHRQDVHQALLTLCGILIGHRTLESSL